ncbi:MAG TPA: ABC transporter permease [Candidatus Brocadiia bacterium]|nr:ABC transporter permease [Candidatus Brocadiia bacterium]
MQSAQNVFKKTLGYFESAGEVVVLLLETLRGFPTLFRRRRLLVRHAYEVGNQSLLIVSVMSLFTGFILALHSGYQLKKFHLENVTSILVGLAITREFGPAMLAFLLAGRIGAAFSAEIGTMQISEEVDALKVMGVNHVSYLSTPRFFACLVMFPILVCYVDFIGIVSGSFMSRTFIDLPYSVYYDQLFRWLEMGDLFKSLFKALLFGCIISMTGCYHGFRTKGGAEGVGRATTMAVVHSILAVLVADYMMEKLLVAFHPNT